MPRLLRQASLIACFSTLATCTWVPRSISAAALADSLRQERGYSALVALDSAITLFRRAVGYYPSTIEQLSRAITTADENSCGAAYGTVRVATWSGPYLPRIVPPTGLPIHIGRARNAVIRTPPTGGANPTLTIRVEDVRLRDAERLNAVVDADRSNVGGAIRWTVSDSPRVVTLDYVRPTSGC